MTAAFTHARSPCVWVFFFIFIFIFFFIFIFIFIFIFFLFFLIFFLNFFFGQVHRGADQNCFNSSRQDPKPGPPRATQNNSLSRLDKRCTVLTCPQMRRLHFPCSL